MTMKAWSNPCDSCRCCDPNTCDRISCRLWKRWFLWRWEMIHGYWEKYGKENVHGLETGSR